MSKSDLEAALIWQIKAARLPEPITEHRFHPPRRFRFDLAWPDRMLAVECEGGVYSGGRHTRGAGFEADLLKYNIAAMDGWTVLRYSGRHIDNGYALSEIEHVLSKVDAESVAVEM